MSEDELKELNFVYLIKMKMLRVKFRGRPTPKKKDISSIFKSRKNGIKKTLALLVIRTVFLV